MPSPKPKRAILVGVDAYAFSPLSASVADAVAVRDKLLSRGLFTPEETTLLIDDGSDPRASGPASRAVILSHLEPLYVGEPCSRLFFYFAGHGISARMGYGVGALNAAILCHGVNDFSRHGEHMINMDELLSRFRMRGPDEQLWVLDACRDIPSDLKAPVVAPLTWPAEDDGAERRRGVLYAVAPLGRARAITGMNGVFTGHFIKALDGAGRAAIRDETGERWMVTLRSAAEYARARQEPTLSEWEKPFLLPRLEQESMPPPEPLRILSPAEAPLPRSVRLKVEPGQATPVVGAQLRWRGQVRVAWPPHQPSPPVEPDVYLLRAELLSDDEWERLEPVEIRVDTREVDEVLLTVQRKPPSETRLKVKGITDSLTFDKGSVVELRQPAGIETISVSTPKRGEGLATLTVNARDPSLELTAKRRGASEAPLRLSANTPIQLQPGLWGVEARLGDELAGSSDVDLAAGSKAVLQVVGSLPAAFRDSEWTMGAHTRPTRQVPFLEVSERMGPIQAGFLPSILPLLALRPFDRGGSLGRLRTTGLKPISDAQMGRSPVGVAVALDGEWGDLPTPEMNSLRLRFRGDGPGETGPHWISGKGLAVMAAPHQLPPPVLSAKEHADPGANLVTLAVPGWGEIEFAVPRLPGRVACAAVTLRPGGVFELSLASFAAAPRPNDSRYYRSQASRAIAVAARVLAAGRTMNVGEKHIRDASFAKWLEPVLGLLAWYAWENSTNEHDRSHFQAAIARNMSAAFPALLDCQILLHSVERRTNEGRRWIFNNTGDALSGVAQFVRQALVGHLGAFPYAQYNRIRRAAEGEIGREKLRYPDQIAAAEFVQAHADQPILAASVDAVADLALAEGRPGHWAVARRGQIEPSSPWNVTFRPWIGYRNNG
jgi:hypothetical protein